MKKYFFSVLLLWAVQSQAQFDTAAISKKVSVLEDTLQALFSRRDWVTYADYMHPAIIVLVGGKDKFADVMQQTMKALDAAHIDSFKTGRVLQVIKSNGQYQCVVESFIQMTLGGMLISGSSYDLAFSRDGNKWSILRIDQRQTAETIKQLVPELSADIKLPKSQYEQGKTLEEFMKTYKVEYMN